MEKTIYIESSTSSYFKINNIEHLLHDKIYNIIILTDKSKVVNSFSTNLPLKMLCILKQKITNSKIVIIVARPTEQKPNQVYKKYLDIAADSSFIQNYWCYVGIKKNGHLETLQFKQNEKRVNLTLKAEMLLFKQGLTKNLSVTSILQNKVTPERYFDHVYVLNRSCQPARLVETSRILESLKLDFTIFEACDSNKYEINHDLTPKTVGQKKSLIRILQNASENNYETIFFMVDQLSLNSDFVAETSRIFKEYPQWDILFLTNSHKQRDRCLPVKKYSTPSWQAMAIDQRVYSDFIHLLEKSNLELNEVIERLISRFRHCYIPNKQLTIDRNSETYRKRGKDFLKPELPSINVILYAEDHSDTIGSAISSLLKQDYQNYRILIIDQSSDGTSNIIKRYANRTNVKLIKSDFNKDRDKKLVDLIVNNKADYTVVLTGNCYVPYIFLSTTVKLLSTEHIDKNVYLPQLISINGNRERNILHKLRLSDRPMFKTAGHREHSSKIFMVHDEINSNRVVLDELVVYRDIRTL